MDNIFQGNDLITARIAKILGYEGVQKHSWFTENIYFSAFFYLVTRFGKPSLSEYDEYKEAGCWSFKVKDFIIQIRMNSVWVEFIVFGKAGNHRWQSPYNVKRLREQLKKRDLLIDLYEQKEDWTDKEKEIIDKLFEKFVKEKNLELIIDELTKEEFDKTYGMEWFGYMQEYNYSVIGIDHKEFTEKFGFDYQNSYTRRALRTLTQFLNNMLTPIWIRDVPYNITGQMKGDLYRRYEDNIKIEYQCKQN